jgi:hypothetical protein
MPGYVLFFSIGSIISTIVMLLLGFICGGFYEHEESQHDSARC